MAVTLLCLCLLLPALLGSTVARRPTCPPSAQSCDQCLQSGPECAWCTDRHASVRCHTSKGLRRAGCRKSHVYNPQGELRVVRNESESGPVNVRASFLRPQEISLHLRPGVAQSFPLTVTVPAGRPAPRLTTDTSNVPSGINVTLTTARAGNLLLVQVNVEALQCPGAGENTGPWSAHIIPTGFSKRSVKLNITLDCQCDCIGKREENSRACSGHGALMCGQCECYQHYIGKQCHVAVDSLVEPNEDFCRTNPDALVCSGRGLCVDGFCECEVRADPAQRYSGRFCECSNFDCPLVNNRICAGHGQCMCGMCVCDADWTGHDCGCSMETASCTASNQQVCNGRGTCDCGTCRCNPPYAGPTCESCPTCEDVCTPSAACVECRAFGTGKEKDRCDQECGHLNVTVVDTKDNLGELGESLRLCRTRSSEDWCEFYHTVTLTPSGPQYTVARTKECVRGA